MGAGEANREIGILGIGYWAFGSLGMGKERMWGSGAFDGGLGKHGGSTGEARGRQWGIVAHAKAEDFPRYLQSMESRSAGGAGAGWSCVFLRSKELEEAQGQKCEPANHEEESHQWAVALLDAAPVPCVRFK